MSKQRVMFTFPPSLVKAPVIYELGRDFRVVTNIRRADVRDDMGWVVLELEGDDEEIKRGLNWVSSTGVQVNLVSGDVIEG